MRIDLITIFPQYFDVLELSLIGKARDAGLLDLRVHDLRAHTSDKHHTVDDTPYGGGPGMVMKPEPWAAALAEVRASGTRRPRLLVPTPSAMPFTQARAQGLADNPWLVLACGRYEGIDARVLDAAAEDFDVEEFSLGDYVLNGGEVAALAVVEAVSRLLPGVVGNAESLSDDSFAKGAMEHLVEGPVFTKPSQWRGRDVPSVLLSGDHAAIARWRREQSLERTSRNRPDLVERLDPSTLTPHELNFFGRLGWAPSDGRLRRTSGPVAD